MSKYREAQVRHRTIGLPKAVPYRPDWDTYFMEIAKAVALRASCPRRKVGAVIVDSNHVIKATGYNGAPSGDDDCLTTFCKMREGHCVRAIHAEENALRYLDYNGCVEYTLYVTVKPCDDCEYLIKQFFNITKIIYLEEYRLREYVAEDSKPAFQAGNEGSSPSTPSIENYHPSYLDGTMIC